ncbi:hypothetical protein PV416_01320 [Streptomyces ipomoeae]|uniref:hypothetical protein n=1 Tax=Streptomyces ipomoeae TaxID=103232 RepID=UPI0029A9D02F|nr:hypothetical protein [Streptomyces ipomoeae]MDX2819753.1 hypothetical protein [Streptomyces ipomoeae]MDX2874988.1 hypothetical protein [Streptomyces ipomoeae]
MDARKSLHAAGLGPVAVAATWSVADRLGVDVADIEAIPGELAGVKQTNATSFTSTPASDLGDRHRTGSRGGDAREAEPAVERDWLRNTPDGKFTTTP